VVFIAAKNGFIQFETRTLRNATISTRKSTIPLRASGGVRTIESLPFSHQTHSIKPVFVALATNGEQTNARTSASVASAPPSLNTMGAAKCLSYTFK
jgi:hypothetical protein